MKLILSFFAVLLLLLSKPGLTIANEVKIPVTDTIPPPPPDSLITISGPTDICVNDTAVYTTDIPLGCSSDWYVDGVLQGSDSSSLQVVWTDDGLSTISLYFVCDSGTSFVDSLVVTVYVSPLKPGDIGGDSAVCENTTHTYSTTVEPNESCEWYVAGELQSSTDTSMTYSFGPAGDYLIEVYAVNVCGTGSQRSFLMVKAAGLAPEPPAPIEGPDESCVGFTETYTTEIGPDEDCQWRVDGVVQESTEPVLEVSWTTTGEHEVEARAVTDCGSSNPTNLQVVVFETPVVNLGNDTTIIQGQSIILDAGNNGSLYLWSTGDTTQTIVVTTSDTYSVDVSNFCGEDSDTILVDVVVSVLSPKETYKLVVFVNGKRLFVETPSQNMLQMYVVNLSGKIIYSGKGAEKVDLPGSGLYVIKIRTDKALFTRKILVFSK
ncbi:MAG: T9SS type A sorting domain-containing protein [Bacteroidales bacterium]|nr:T9SS type A sorting domain-containing protein [Bacteroidales bacterium]MCF6342190.1 T9SS type A sorting domain-containing protein [Bacteroidales bacterium]